MKRKVWGTGEEDINVDRSVVDIILWEILHPNITVFKEDMEEWIDIASREVALNVYTNFREELNRLSRDGLEFATKAIMAETVGEVRERVYFFAIRDIVVMEGKFGMGERVCKVFYKTTFLHDIVDKSVVDKAMKILLESIKTGKEIEKPEKSRKDTYFEYTLDQHIFTIYTQVLNLWKLEFSMDVAKKLLERGFEGMAVKIKTREILTSAMERIVEVLEEMSSEYVNIVLTDPELDELIGRLVPTSDFISKLYRLTYDKTIEIFELLKKERKEKKV